MPSEVFFFKNCRRNYTNPLRKNTETILLMTTVLNQLFFNQRDKRIGKRIDFYVERSVS